MKFKLSLLGLIIPFLFGLVQLTSGQDPDELISTRLFSDASEIKPGDSIWLGVEIDVEEGWHVYWRTAGDTGFPTEVEWMVDDGVQIAPALYPAPYFYEYQGSASYAYKGKILLLSRLTLPADGSSLPSNITIQGELSALVCNESNCLPYKKEINLELPVGEKTELVPSRVQEISESLNSLPVHPSEGVRISGIVKGDAIGIEVQSPDLEKLAEEGFDFFAEGDFFDHAFRPKFKKHADGLLIVTLKRSDSSDGVSESVGGVLAHPDFERAWSMNLQVEQAIYGKASETLKPSSLSVTQDPESPAASESGLPFLWTLLGMVLVAFAVWVYGKTNQPVNSSSQKTRGRVLTLVFLGAGVWLGYPKDKHDSGLTWETWSPERQESLLAEGTGVYVDYTAKWCQSCQFNKRIYESEEVIAQFEKLGIVPLRADWTKEGPTILESLESYGRKGVPLNVYYPPAEQGEEPQPILFSEVLTENSVLTVLKTGKPYRASESGGFPSILGFAFLGGLILNLMPCVFPVLGLKIMSFVKQAGEEKSKISRHGFIFTTGVVLSFWSLVGVLFALRETLGEDLGWGFQLQEPAFVFILAVFLLIFAMSLSGVFEIGLSMIGVGSKLSQKSGYAGSFFSGVLATVVATPCMAPFLGVAVGAALTMDMLPAFAIFTSVAIGLSFPYLLLSVFPGWISKLPKPGAWMDTFKQAMAFPLYATVVWLLWTFASLL
ncbi:protein-disulfide reductase DsbD family protein [Verrucomicrobia bacterium]|nr:protein-disulfide reductase DsbD family protein [Verrucomicrobiota bacterium]